MVRFSAEERERRPQHCFIPFGLGPRSCIAMRFVQLVAKVTIIEVLKKYTFLRVADTEVKVKKKIQNLNAMRLYFLGSSGAS